jgi:PKD repeat protein
MMTSLAAGSAVSASAASVLYVDGAAGSGCSDTGPGSQAAPFCSIQAAANVTEPGQTVEITAGPGVEYGAVDITRSGTPGNPIIFTSATPGGAMPQVYPGGNVPSITISGASDIVVSYLNVQHFGANIGVRVTGSHGVTLDRLNIDQDGASTAATSSVAIDGTSSQVTLSRSEIFNEFGYGVSIAAGAQQVAVSTNFLSGAILSSAISPAGGIVADGVVSATFTSNSIEMACGNAIGITGTSTAVVENNVLGAAPAASCPSGGSALSVAASSTVGVREDYNALYAADAGSEYSWLGTAYSTAAAFSTATGQGAHDQDAGVGASRYPPSASSPLIDSADCSAPGELATDMYGHARVRDPLATPTGTGTCYADRGAAELQDPLAVAYALNGSTKQVAPFALMVTITSGATSPWGEAVSYSVDFGDGGGPQPAAVGGSLSHTYSTPGQYTLAVTATDTGGSTLSRDLPVVAGTVTPPTQTLSAGPMTFSNGQSQGIAVDTGAFTIGSAGPDAWEVTSESLAFGDGSSENLSASTSNWTHGYPGPGTYTATLTVHDEFGRTTTSTATVTVGNEFIPTTPEPDLVPATGGAYAVKSHRVLAIPVSRLDGGDFSFIAGVQLVVSATDPKSTGTLTAYPAGSSRPRQATIDFKRGQPVASPVLVGAATGGAVDFYNNSRRTLDLGLVTTGVEVTGNTSGGEDGYTYAALRPVRVLDTRSTTPVGGRRRVTFSLASAGLPASATVVVLEVTATRTRQSGTSSVENHDKNSPGVPIPGPYWAARQTVTNMIEVPVTTGRFILLNSSKESADFIVDVVGYYDNYGTNSVFLPDQAQLTGSHSVAVGARRSVTVSAGACLGAPASDISAAAVTISASGALAPGYLTAYPAGQPQAATRIVSYPARASIAASTILQASSGQITLRNEGNRPVQISVGLAGCYFSYPGLLAGPSQTSATARAGHSQAYPTPLR